MSFANSIRETFSPLVDLVYPPRCPACGEGIGEQAGLCASCWDDLHIPTEPWCATCQRPFVDAAVQEGAICAPCMASPPRHDGIASGTLYNDTARKLVLAFKHGGRIALAPMLARLVAARMGPAQPGNVLVPVPLHRWRLWRRGFNQAALLARELERRGHGRMLPDGLIRTRHTPALGGLGAKARQRALAGAIRVRPRAKPRIAGRDVWLIDDVLTSGATSAACVAALKKGGARSVRIACFSRVLDEITRTNKSPDIGPANETPGTAGIPGAT